MLLLLNATVAEAGAESALDWVEKRRKGGPDRSIEEAGIHLRRGPW